MCKKWDIQLNEIPDRNCCGASIGYAEGGELPRHVMNARNLAISEQGNKGQDVVATCAACWLGVKEAKDRLAHDSDLLAETNEALREAGMNLQYKGEQEVRHMVEVLIEDLG